MTDTKPKTQRTRMPVVGQRVPKETLEAFNKVASEDYNVTPAHALRCLMNAFANRKGKGVETLLKVQISTGVTKSEVKQELESQLACVEKRLFAAIDSSIERMQKQDVLPSATIPSDSSTSNKPKILKSVRWDADLFEQLEAKAVDVGGFSKLLNLIAGEWLRQRPEGIFETIQISSQLAKEIEVTLKKGAS